MWLVRPFECLAEAIRDEIASRAKDDVDTCSLVDFFFEIRGAPALPGHARLLTLLLAPEYHGRRRLPAASQ